MAANSGSIIIIHLNNITLIEDNNCQFILLAATFWQQLLQIFLLIWLEVFIHIGFGVCVFFFVCLFFVCKTDFMKSNAATYYRCM